MFLKKFQEKFKKIIKDAAAAAAAAAIKLRRPVLYAFVIGKFIVSEKRKIQIFNYKCAVIVWWNYRVTLSLSRNCEGLIRPYCVLFHGKPLVFVKLNDRRFEP